MIGLAPLVMLLATWSDNPRPAEGLIKAFAAPVLLVEIAVALVAVPIGARLSFPPKLVSVSLLTLIVVAWATALTARHPIPAAIRTEIWIVHLVYGVSLAGLAARSLIDPADFVDAFLTGFLVFSGLFVMFAASVTQPDYNIGRDLPAFSNIRWYGYYAVAAIGLAAWGFTDGRKYQLFAATVAFSIIFWTGSRGATVMSVTGFAIAALVFPTLRRPSVWVRYIMAFIIGLFIAIMLDAGLPVPNQGPERLALVGGNGRIEVWMSVFENILRQPWFGWGEGQVRYIPGIPASAVQPHNVVLQVVHAWGVIGAVLLLVPSVWVTRLVLSNTSDRTLPFVCTAIILVAYSSIDSTLYQVHVLSIFAACVAIGAAAPQEAKYLSGT
jgi:O-antigen ligase